MKNLTKQMHETFNNQLIKTERYVVDKERIRSKLEVFLKDADFEDNNLKRSLEKLRELIKSSKNLGE